MRPYFHTIVGPYRVYALYQANSLQQGKKLDRRKYHFHAEKKYIDFTAKRDDKISPKILVKKANKHNMISNNVNFWKKDNSINVIGIFYLQYLFIIDILC